jgi:hypothetical protein
MMQLLDDRGALIHHITQVLHSHCGPNETFQQYELVQEKAAGILLLLGPKPGKGSSANKAPHFILNKRSQKVRQPGDLCCPGGSVAPRFDSLFAKLLSLPIASLGSWEYWPEWKKKWPRETYLLSLFWATGLRESFEEMRLNPLGVRFLGLLPPQPLVMFQRTIYPMVAWIARQKRFFPNWEVEKIVAMPISDLLNSANYGRFRLRMESFGNTESSESMRDLPCFRFRIDDNEELLWGATYRVISSFLEYVFNFRPPATEDLPVTEGTLGKNYLTGQNARLHD